MKNSLITELNKKLNHYFISKFSAGGALFLFGRDSKLIVDYLHSNYQTRVVGDGKFLDVYW